MRCLIWLPFILVFMLACSNEPQKVTGEIVGVQARVLLSDFQDGQIKRTAYAGNLAVLLPDSQQVVVACPRELLTRIRDCPYFNVDSLSGDFMATITLKVDKRQRVVLERGESGEWLLSEILL